MRYFQYTNLTNTTTHTFSSNCNFNLGIWFPAGPTEVNLAINVSLDGTRFVTYSIFSLHSTIGGSAFYSEILPFKAVQVQPLDGETFNFAVGEHYTPMNLMLLGS